MKEISTQTIILPLIAVIGAIIIVSLIATSSMRGIRQGCDVIASELTVCQNTLNEKEEILKNTLEKLNLTEQDLSKFDTIYNETAQEAELLAQELEDEKGKEPLIIYNVPHRSVPDADSFSKAAKIELMIERIGHAESLLSKEFVPDHELRMAVGYAYLNSVDFRNLFLDSSGNAIYPREEDAYDSYKTNEEQMEELEGMFNDFDEFKKTKLKTRLGQILKIQRNIFIAMQSQYFLR